MSDDRTGRELTPRPEEEPSAVTPREPALPQPTTAPVARFSAGEQTHTVGLTEERAAQIVRSSGNARMVAFLAALLLVLFIPLYWLYDIGLPFIGVGGRLDNEAKAQQVTDVSRGYALFLANCARCHGQQGQGGIGPPLNDQGKLYQAVTPQGAPGPGHLNPNYLYNVLSVGGRYVCGDPKSVMPVWLQPNGPLNYREVNEIIAFIIASNQTSWVYRPATGETVDATPPPAVTVQGWRDPNYSPPPGSTPVPDCWRAPASTAAVTTTPAPVTSPGTAEHPRVIELHATEQLKWVDASGTPVSQLAVVAGEVIEFHLVNDSQAVPHNFHIAGAADLSTAAQDNSLPGVQTFTGANGPQAFTFTVANLPQQPQFACTVSGHYTTMHGDLVLTTAGAGASASPAPSASASSAAPSSSASAAPVPSATATP
jgi:mono/diheme cytochrome c family protein